MFDLQASINEILSMTSKEMADLTEKRHDNVKRLIESLANQGVITFPQIEEASFTGIDGRKQAVTVYRINKRDSYIIVAQLSPGFTARLVDLWQQLEDAIAKATVPTVPQTLPEALRLAADMAEQKAKADAALAIAAPKAQAFDRIANTEASLCITDAAKTLQIRPKQLTQLLCEQRWIYRRPMSSTWLAYQDRIQQGFLEHKVMSGERSDGPEWTSTQVRVTAKGLTKISEILAIN